MADGHSPSIRQHGPHEGGSLDKNKLAIGGEVLAVASQVTVSLLQLDNQTKIAFFVMFVLAGLMILVWWSGGKPATSGSPPRKVSNLLIALLLGGTLVGVVAIAMPTIREKILDWRLVRPPPVQLVYYMLVRVYRDDAHDGERDGTDVAISGIPIVIRDEFGGSYPNHMTDRNGNALIHLPRFGEISLGVCHEFQTHHVGYDSDAPTRPTVVEVGVDPSQMGSCAN